MCLSFGSLLDSIIGKCGWEGVCRGLIIIYIGRLEKKQPRWGWEDVDLARAQPGLGMFHFLGIWPVSKSSPWPEMLRMNDVESCNWLIFIGHARFFNNNEIIYASKTVFANLYWYKTGDLGVVKTFLLQYCNKTNKYFTQVQAWQSKCFTVPNMLLAINSSPNYTCEKTCWEYKVSHQSCNPYRAVWRIFGCQTKYHASFTALK